MTVSYQPCVRAAPWCRALHQASADVAGSQLSWCLGFVGATSVVPVPQQARPAGASSRLGGGRTAAAAPTNQSSWHQDGVARLTGLPVRLRDGDDLGRRGRGASQHRGLRSGSEAAVVSCDTGTLRGGGPSGGYTMRGRCRPNGLDMGCLSRALARGPAPLRGGSAGSRGQGPPPTAP